MELLKVKNLQVEFESEGRSVQAVRGLDYYLAQGESLAIVGESGCGKSVSLMAVNALLDKSAKIHGEILFQGKDLRKLNEKEINHYRGSEIGMVFQDPMSALNPTMKVGEQIAEVLRVHKGSGKSESLNAAIELMENMGINDSALRAGQYPFEFSGGMLQRAAIAIAVAAKPKLIIADEPTTALDVTVQKQVLELLKAMQAQYECGLILVTHDLALVAETCDKVLVMYAGKGIEKAARGTLFKKPLHPYTQGLIEALPYLDQDKQKALKPIKGNPPDLANEIEGCAFASRCPKTMNICRQHQPENYEVDDSWVSCWLYSPEYQKNKNE